MLSPNWSKDGDELTLLRRLKDNATALKATEQGDFLRQLHEVFVASEQGDFREKVMSANRALTLQNEALRQDRRTDQREITTLKAELTALKAKLTALETQPTVPAPAEESNQLAMWKPDGVINPNAKLVLDEAAFLAAEPGLQIEIANVAEFKTAFPEVPDEAKLASVLPVPAPCTCRPSDAELVQYVREVAAKHGMELGELSFTITEQGFVVSNNVPIRGRVRSRRSESLDAAIGSLRAELNQ